MSNTNPPNDFITDAMWQLWLAVDTAIPQVKLGGVYAAKAGYHNTRKANQAKWPGNYSIQLDLDKQGPADKSAAIDLTFSAASDMRKYTKRLQTAMLAGDSRLASVKEFYGTLDSKTVYGLGKKIRTSEPYTTSADSSHLWHLHVSFFRADVENFNRLKGLYEVLTGSSAPEPAKPSVPPVEKPSGGSQPAPGPYYTFPLPAGFYFGPKDGGKNSVSGYYGRKFKSKTDNAWLKLFVAQLGKRGWSVGKGKQYLGRYGNDGQYGSEYAALIKAFQRNQGLKADGLLGPATWKAAFSNPVG